MSNKTQASARVENEPSKNDGAHLQKNTLTFEDLVVEGSLTPVSIQMLPEDAKQPTWPEDGLLTELQCEV